MADNFIKWAFESGITYELKRLSNIIKTTQKLNFFITGIRKLNFNAGKIYVLK